MSAVHEAETIWSAVYPGNFHTVQCLQPAVKATETALALSSEQRQRTVWRLDGGAGSDEQVLWLLARGYHILAKGMSHRRAEALAKQVLRWDPYGDQAWLGEVAPPMDYGRPVRVFVKRRQQDGQFRHSYYLSTLALPSKSAFLRLYDARGAAEVEPFRNDKTGLSLEARRKRSFTGQQGYILLTDLAHNLTDLAHNLLTDFAHRGLAGSAFAGYGLKRIVRDLLSMPGRVSLTPTQVRIDLLSQNQFAEELATCLVKYCSG
ncbi:MAG: hypothetical protein NZM42_11530 [Gemmatales bacterium]|nr:hypothetical protein [Gemmatales bacterium]MDW8224093.1 hypothetical protein [Gemmatales bacterium]